MITPDSSPSLSQDTSVLLNTHVGGRRLAALALDFVLLLMVQLWIYAAFGILLPSSLNTISLPPITPSNPWFTVDWFGELLLMVVYFIVLEASLGTTIGKLIMGLRVTDTQGQHALFRAILLRNVLRLVDILPLISMNFDGITFNIPYLLGGIVALSSPYRQRLGDRLAHTLVVDAASVPLSSRSSHDMRQRFLQLTSLALLVVAWFGSLYLFQPSLIIKSQIHIDPSITSYTIGAPTRTVNTVNYPFSWKGTGSPYVSSANIGLSSPQPGSIEDSPIFCHAQMTLRWSFLIPGWRIADGEWECLSATPDKNGSSHSYKGSFHQSQ